MPSYSIQFIIDKRVKLYLNIHRSNHFTPVSDDAKYRAKPETFELGTLPSRS